MNFHLWLVVYLIPLEIQGHTVAHLKALTYGKYETRGLSCGSTLSIFKDVLKSGNLLHKRGFVDSQTVTTISNIRQPQKCDPWCVWMNFWWNNCKMWKGFLKKENITWNWLYPYSSFLFQSIETFIWVGRCYNWAIPW